ncbi:MAG: alpha/beta hydrolase [Lachnospiraceae bacterium]|nr:alpha/beta hydrolase [Lachnospiraceae bacterium]
MPYIRANGIRIAFDTFGSLKNKPLFLIHGLTGQRMSMEKLAEQLSDEFFVITYDCRGHGQTDHPAAYDLADHGRDLLALIDVLGYEQASVLGASMGSYIALQAAELDPAKIDKLILVTAKSYDDGSGSSVQRLLREAGLDMATAPPEERSRILSTALWSPNVSKELLTALAPRMKLSGENVVPLTPEETVAVNQALVGFDLRRDLENVSCQTLVISGTYDKINPPAFGKEIAEKIPLADYVEFPGGHLLTMEFEEDYVRCVRTFLEK